MNGILNIFKPKGMSSFDVVRVVKKVAKTGKVGHTGTLDPEATGVLPVCIGRATKIIDYIMDSEKVYEVTFKLGIRTTTYDLEGEVLEEKDWGKRRLAYEIEDFKEGFYNIVRIKTDNNRATDEFQRLAKISDDIIRYIVIREDQDK